MKSYIAGRVRRGAILAGFGLFMGAFALSAEKLVILHTNDTHSQIDPIESSGLGGVERRAAVIDSIRAVEPNVLVVDVGDAVQGTLYFYLYGGVVEQKLLNAMGVDLRILGNHEFDNGIDSLATVMKISKAKNLSTNYFLEDSPLAGMFSPYDIRTYGGKRIGFIALNLDPRGMIADGNYDGLVFTDIIPAANLTARYLREIEKVDAVVALTHIGYDPARKPGDLQLAAASKDIDIIIGGHSHDTIGPDDNRRLVRNADGREVLVVQTGKSGARLGKIEIELDSLASGASPRYELITLDGTSGRRRVPRVGAIVDEYRAGVDSLMNMWLTRADRDMARDDVRMLNYMADFVYDRGNEIAPGVELAIINKGGLRCDIPKGKVSKGQLINLVPFRNNIRIIDLKGSDLIAALDSMAITDGNGVSRQVDALYDRDARRTVRATVGGKAIVPGRIYRVATIDYLADGGDYLTSLRNGVTVANSDVMLFDDLIRYVTVGKGKGKPFGNGEKRVRMRPAVSGN